MSALDHDHASRTVPHPEPLPEVMSTRDVVLLVGAVAVIAFLLGAAVFSGTRVLEAYVSGAL